MTPHPPVRFCALLQDIDGGQPVKTLNGLAPSELGLGGTDTPRQSVPPVCRFQISRHDGTDVRKFSLVSLHFII